MVAFVIWLIGLALRYVLSGTSRRSATPEAALNALAWEDTYAQRIYTALPASDSLGDITPEKLRIPPAAMQRYFEKALLQRETMCFVALMSCARPDTNLQPVMMAYGRLLIRELVTRGIPADIDALADVSLTDMDRLLKEPFAWAQNWLAEFRNDPNDNYMVVMFADHCQRQFNAYKTAIIETIQTAR